MNNRSRRITGSILAVLAATVVACGAIQGSAGTTDPQHGGGGAQYLTADDSYGVGLRRPDINRDYPPQEQDVPEFLKAQIGVSGPSVPAGALAGGYCPSGWCPTLEP
jgi:hypothetical protein